MRHRTFFWFILPTATAMLLFIAMPIVSVVCSRSSPRTRRSDRGRKLHPACRLHDETTIDQEATRELREAEPLGRFVGWILFRPRSSGHPEVREAWNSTSTWGDFGNALANLPFYRAMNFTLVFTFVVTPLVILLGLMIALAVNALHARLKGVMIFFSLLPFVITPLIGALVLFWMIDSRGIVGSALVALAGDPNFSLKASTGLMWVSLITYGVWHAAPFAFVIFYAGLQTLPMDQIEAAQIDGATRWQRVRYIVVPI